ncbi:hypothetical protein [Hymenobacter jeollabukensis]|uniref:Porin family protein n=1 Tax=Hymenobacter jeollabukensis TaxID=2025313 RepID=A0A5R8WWW7_9BACT|nr:hypothetical protein [Hymenobacter jeollabukensis]TLM97020.1 hypothetical protein FDY95_03255 [Hymenobacter jeollabukensis]
MRLFLPAVLLSLLSATAVSAQTAAPTEAPTQGLRPASRVSYSLNAGAMFAGRYGSATYLSPQANYQLTNRLQLFGGLTYLRTLPGAYQPATEGGRRPNGWAGTNHYLIQGGGTYALSPRLFLTGSAWKDLTPTTPGTLVNPYAGFGGNLGQGVNLRADYHVTEHFSVSGGVRVSQGATAPGYAPGLGTPLGY